MINKTKMSNLESYQELSIQIACLSMKIDKVLELLNKPEEVMTIDQDIRFIDGKPGHGASYLGVLDYINKDAFAGPIGSEDEKFLEEFK